MRKPALIALAALFAATGAVSTASAALSDRDVPAWRMVKSTEVAARGGERGARQDGGRGRDSGRDKKNDDIWRLRDGRHRPFWHLHRDRGPDCFVEKRRVRDSSGKRVDCVSLTPRSRQSSSEAMKRFTYSVLSPLSCA